MSTFTEKVKSALIVRDIRNAIGNSKYLLVVNGIIRRYNKSAVFVKAVDDDLMFFTKRRADRVFLDYDLPSMYNKILAELSSSVLFGNDFTTWMNEYSTNKNQSFHKVSANHALRILFIETDIYNLFRQAVPSVNSANLQFVPQVNGRDLQIFELSNLLTEFRLNGFRSVLGLSEFKLISAIRRKSRPIYRLPISEQPLAFFPAMIRCQDMFNPFYDDMQIRDLLKDRKLFQDFARTSRAVSDLGITVSHLTSTQVSEGLGLSRHIPFNFAIVYNILIALTMDVADLPYEFPHKSRVVYRLRTAVEGYPVSITEQTYSELSEYERSVYLRTSTYSLYLQEQAGFFRTSGLSNASNLLETMAAARLV